MNRQLKAISINKKKERKEISLPQNLQQIRKQLSPLRPVRREKKIKVDHSKAPIQDKVISKTLSFFDSPIKIVEAPKKSKPILNYRKKGESKEIGGAQSNWEEMSDSLSQHSLSHSQCQNEDLNFEAISKMEEEKEYPKVISCKKTSEFTFDFSNLANSPLPQQQYTQQIRKEFTDQTNLNGNGFKEAIAIKIENTISGQDQSQNENFSSLNKKKRDLGLRLPVHKISLVAKEVPLSGSSNKKKNIFTFYDNFHEFTVFCDITMKKGSRNYQEDRFSAVNPIDNKYKRDSFFAVYDGHGTVAIADTLKENLHKYICENENYPNDIIRSVKESFQKIDEEILAKQRENQICSGGSTALCCLVREDQIYIINCGDSSSVMVKNDYEVEVLNNLHKPSMQEEAKRLDQQNTIYTDSRVMDCLGVTRSVGDFLHKKYIISEPEIQVYKIDENSKYCLLGTDGFWDIIKPSDLPELLRNRDSQFQEGEKKSLKDLSTVLVEHASAQCTIQKKDNMTLLAIDLNWFYSQNEQSQAYDSLEEDNLALDALSSQCIMCSSKLDIDTPLSSFIFQAKSPHLVCRSIEKKYSLQSLGNQSRGRDSLNINSGPRTCNKRISKRQVFFPEEPLLVKKTTSFLQSESIKKDIESQQQMQPEHNNNHGNNAENGLNNSIENQPRESPSKKDQSIGKSKKKTGNFFEFF